MPMDEPGIDSQLPPEPLAHENRDQTREKCKGEIDTESAKEKTPEQHGFHDPPVFFEEEVEGSIVFYFGPVLH